MFIHIKSFQSKPINKLVITKVNYISVSRTLQFLTSFAFPLTSDTCPYATTSYLKHLHK